MRPALGQIENHRLDSFTVWLHPRYMVEHQKEEIHTLTTTQAVVEGVIVDIKAYTTIL